MDYYGYAIITSRGKEGYHCIESSGDLSEDIIRDIEAYSLPFGNGWSQYTGARSIKVFCPSADTSKMTISYSRVLDPSTTDDVGRTGVLYGKCYVISPRLLRFLLINYEDFGFEHFFESDNKKLENVKIDKNVWEINSHKSEHTRNPLVKKILKNNPNLVHDKSAYSISNHEFQSVEQWKKIEIAIRGLAILQSSTEPDMLDLSFCTLTLSAYDPVKLSASPLISRENKKDNSLIDNIGVNDSKTREGKASTANKTNAIYEQLIDIEEIGVLRIHVKLSRDNFVVTLNIEDNIIGKIRIRNKSPVNYLYDTTFLSPVLYDFNNKLIQFKVKHFQKGFLSGYAELWVEKVESGFNPVLARIALTDYEKWTQIT